HEVFDHKAAELLTNVEDVMREAMFHRRLSCIVEAVYIAAAGFLLAAAAGCIVPGLHGDAHNFIALIMQHQRGYRAVDASAHGYQNLSLPAHISEFCKRQR